MYPRITFTMTTFSRFKLFLTTMDSFLETCLDKDLIINWVVSDDGSDPKEVKMMKNLYPFLSVVSNPGRGQAANLNNLFSRVTTEWFFHCLKGKTVIETKDGGKYIKDVKVGDLVKTHTGRFKKVTKTFKNYLEQRSSLLWIKTPHSTIKITPEHPFLVFRDGKSYKKQWVKAINLKQDDLLLYPFKQKRKEKSDFVTFNCNDRWNKWKKLKVDKDVARFFGLYLAEGHTGHDSIKFTIGNHEEEIKKFLINFCKKQFLRKPTVYKNWATTVKLNIRSFSHLFSNWFGSNAKEKKIPEFVFQWNVLNKLHFIKGYVEGDGHVYKTGNAVVVTVSKNLVSDFMKLCSDCGLMTKIEKRKPSEKSSYGGGISYGIHIKTTSWRKLCDILEGKQIEDYIAIPICEIQNKKQSINDMDMHVYNLEVEGDNSYIANSVIVHNCEDDWLFKKKDNYIRKMLDVMFENPKIKNTTLRYWEGGESAITSTGVPYNVHVYNPDAPEEEIYKNDAWWCGYTLNPGLQHKPTVDMLGKYDETLNPHKRNWDRPQAVKYYEMGLKRGNLMEDYIEHIGDNNSAYMIRLRENFI